MKFLLSLMASFLLIGTDAGRTGITADNILQKMADQLQQTRKISYQSKRELNYASEDYHAEQRWTNYFEFSGTDSLIGFKYQVSDEKQIQVFNGTEAFDLDKAKKSISLSEHPTRESLSARSFLYNSIITLKNVLPALIKDKSIHKSIRDTSLAGVSCHLISLNINQRRIQNLGTAFDKMPGKINFIYKLIVDKITYLPVEIIQVNDGNTDFIKTSFTELNTAAIEPTELSWYYSTYIGEYKQALPKESIPLIAVGADAPDFSLPIYNQTGNATLSGLHEQVVLLDFWIRNCGPCISSVPEINALKAKFAGKPFKILSINAYDLKKDIESFYIKHHINYDVLMLGRETAEKYGVPGFPTIVLINKEGKVIYSSVGFDKSAIEQQIVSAL
jgi:thiol-disulfide isomerase/thioredoxin